MADASPTDREAGTRLKELLTKLNQINSARALPADRSKFAKDKTEEFDPGSD